MSKFNAKPNKPLGFRQTVKKYVKAICNSYLGFRILLQVFRAYEERPEQPDREIPEEIGDIPDEQLALCQALFDKSENRRARIEKKALWTFAAIAFLTPILTSLLVHLFQGNGASFKNNQPSQVLLILSAILLFSSFISVWRALCIRANETVHIHAVIKEKDGYFIDYDKKTHAQGLLYFTIQNTAFNDHIAQFVKNAHTLLVLATISFVMSAISIVFFASNPNASGVLP